MSSSPGGAVPVETKFITCFEVLELLKSCKYNQDKRVLFLDVRPRHLYDASHLCLDSRMQKGPVMKQMRVINIDVTRIGKPIIASKIIDTLDSDDHKIFRKRKDADDVIVMDDGKSKNNFVSQEAEQVIAAITKWDCTQDKIKVQPKVLIGGFPEWLDKYAQYTTDPQYEIIRQRQPTATINNSTKAATTGTILTPTRPNIDANERSKDTQIELSTSDIPPKEHIIPIQYEFDIAPPMSSPVAVLPKQAPAVPPKPSHQVQQPRPQPTPPQPSQPQPQSQLTLPSDRRHSLPRSNSSPNVAQDENMANNFRDPSNHLANLVSNNHHLVIQTKPKFNRAQKPNHKINNELVRAIMAQLNFEPVVHGTVGQSITGLKNLGNTCFMNSVIQCLAYTPSIVSYFSNENYINHIDFHGQYGTKGELAIQLGALVEKLNAHQYRSLTPKSFRETVVRHIGFGGGEQQDSHEFMMMLFDKLHHDLNRHGHVAKQLQSLNLDGEQHNGNNITTNNATDNVGAYFKFWRKHTEQNKSLISEEFEGTFMSTLTCQACGNQSSTFELFNCLSLPITSTTRCTLQECLSHFSRTERIEAAWECSGCKQKREADKKIVICKLPKILIIHLKRFSQDGPWRQKLQTTVDFPLSDLTVENAENVSPHTAYGQETPNNIKPLNRYNLYAVVNHYGSLDGGHYIACSKLDDKQRWFKFDDNEVSEIKKTDLCIKSAYILFYSLNDSKNHLGE